MGQTDKQTTDMTTVAEGSYTYTTTTVTRSLGHGLLHLSCSA